MTTFSKRSKNLFDYQKTPLSWVDQQTLPDFTDFRSFSNWLSNNNTSLNYIDDSYNRAIECVDWAIGEVDTSTKELLHKRYSEVQNECMFHLSMILTILEHDHEFKINVEFNLPPGESADWPIDKFGQPDVIMMPLQQMLLKSAEAKGIHFEERDIWTMGCCACATCLCMIYHEMEGRKSSGKSPSTVPLPSVNTESVWTKIASIIKGGQ